MPHNINLSTYLRPLCLNSVYLISLALLPFTCNALTCPTLLKKNGNSTWHAPGFYPHFIYHSKAKKLRINSHQFGAALYNLKTKRLTCTYKTNNRIVKWASFQTRPNGRIKPDINAIHHHSHTPLWQYSPKNHDYACTESRQNCVFNLEQVMSSHK